MLRLLACIPGFSWPLGVALGKNISAGAHPYTGKSHRIVSKRFDKHFPDSVLEQSARERTEIIHCAFLFGNNWDWGTELEPSFRDTLLAMDNYYDQQKQPRRGNYDGLFDMHEINAVRTPSARKGFKGRQGARQVRKVEQEVTEGGTLTPESATMYRAVSARANYLAQDRPDIAYTSQEVCRDFAVPSIH